jgi:hypothetical protein
MSNTYLTSPNTQINGKYTGVAYVLDSIGGFSVDQTFSQIKLSKLLPHLLILLLLLTTLRKHIL